MPDSVAPRPPRIIRPQLIEIEEARKSADEALKRMLELKKLPIYPP